ncbi:glycosyltransferase [Salinicola rhizosphaerae]|uniref:Oleandomycin glycosyltransferase n=1 Tax=Salinicola rhizosphaerae TaxID=1443141 RepID=A0ABQ3EIL3_9GAMM|nr:glycosyltransferase [Salinicola rhizosphaerae]GHB33599.1 oleandomycin glycosyltransferase [Salinicola rhizosphaerae]
MSHFAVVAPPLYSHFQALEALAVTLIGRGHRVTFVHRAAARPLIRDARINFTAIDTPTAAFRSGHRAFAMRASALSIRRVIVDMAASTDELASALPPLLDRLGVDAVIADQMEAAGGLVAEGVGLPFVSVACALPVDREAGLPLPVMPFSYATDARARQQYAASERIYDWLMRPHARVIATHAARFGLGRREALHHCLSPLGQISQTPATLDFPRQALPAHFHAVGPLRSPTSARGGRWTIDADRPFVFASFGTLQGHRFGLFEKVARACRRIGARLLVAHCGGLTAHQARRLQSRGATFVTDFADQHAALAQADAVVTHGGLNTVLDAITAETPMLVIPLAFDQPGVAARVAWHGLGERASRFASAGQIAEGLSRLLASDDYRQRLAASREGLISAGGVERAARLVEAALVTRTAGDARATGQAAQPQPAVVS